MKFLYVEYHSTKCGSDLQTHKDDVPHNFGLKISGISRQQILSMLVILGAQYSHLHQVLLPILPSTSFVAISLLLAYGSKPNFSKSVILSVSEPDKDRDSLEDMLLPNKMIRKNELGYIAYSAVIKQERNLPRHDVMKLPNRMEN